MKTTHGGPREGSGRPADWGTPKRSLTVRLTPLLLDFLDSREASAAAQIEDSLRATNAFRRYKSDLENGPI